jgi:hypothetical protein
LILKAPGDHAPLVITVTHARRALAEAAAWWEGDPSDELIVIGVTGTDGKTTTASAAGATRRVSTRWRSRGRCRDHESRTRARSSGFYLLCGWGVHKLRLRPP